MGHGESSRRWDNSFPKANSRQMGDRSRLGGGGRRRMASHDHLPFYLQRKMTRPPSDDTYNSELASYFISLFRHTHTLCYPSHAFTPFFINYPSTDRFTIRFTSRIPTKTINSKSPHILPNSAPPRRGHNTPRATPQEKPYDLLRRIPELHHGTFATFHLPPPLFLLQIKSEE